jgi:hypothetical protein
MAWQVLLGLAKPRNCWLYYRYQLAAALWLVGAHAPFCADMGSVSGPIGPCQGSCLCHTCWLLPKPLRRVHQVVAVATSLLLCPVELIIMVWWGLKCPPPPHGEDLGGLGCWVVTAACGGCI